MRTGDRKATVRASRHITKNPCCRQSAEESQHPRPKRRRRVGYNRMAAQNQYSGFAKRSMSSDADAVERGRRRRGMQDSWCLNTLACRELWKEGGRGDGVQCPACIGTDVPTGGRRRPAAPVWTRFMGHLSGASHPAISVERWRKHSMATRAMWFRFGDTIRPKVERVKSVFCFFFAMKKREQGPNTTRFVGVRSDWQRRRLEILKTHREGIIGESRTCGGKN